MSHGGRHVYVSDFDENRIKQNFIFLKRDTVLLWGREGGQAIEGGIVFNDEGDNVDFRVESDTNQNMLFVDASTNRVGIGTATPGYMLDVVSSGNADIRAISTANGAALLELGHSTQTWRFQVQPTTGDFFFFDATNIKRPFRVIPNSAEHSLRVETTGVAINTATKSTVAQLDVVSTTRGFLPPRMTTTQRDAISSPPNGLMIYNTTTNTIQAVYAGTWTSL